MTSVNPANTLKIGLIGPHRIGKTTLINCLLRSGETLLSRTQVAMRWADGPTERKIQILRDELEGWLVSRKFNPGTMSGTESPFYFQLKFDPGLPEAELGFEILDYPGGCLDPRRRAGYESEWARCQQFLNESTVLLIPVDAAILMETIGEDNRQYLPANLGLSAVDATVRDWARARHLRFPEPALAIVCPIRTEHYFADNGGRQDRSADLHNQVQEVYGRVLRTIREEAPATRVRYCPVDTIGCVEFMSAEWIAAEGARTPLFSAQYRIRRRADGAPPRISMAGSDDVLVLIARHLFDLGENDLRDHARNLQRSADQVDAWANRDDGVWRNFWYRLSGQRSQWQDRAAISRGDAHRATEVVAHLGRQLEGLADHELSPRTREL